jgi:hypothetical protein
MSSAQAQLGRGGPMCSLPTKRVHILSQCRHNLAIRIRNCGCLTNEVLCCFHARMAMMSLDLSLGSLYPRLHLRSAVCSRSSRRRTPFYLTSLATGQPKSCVTFDSQIKTALPLVHSYVSGSLLKPHPDTMQHFFDISM